MSPLQRLIILILCPYTLFLSWLVVTYPEPIIYSSAVNHVEKVIVKEYDGLARTTCYGPTGYRTASMKTPRNGMIATSDRTIPLGTKIEIEGYGVMTVEDRTAKSINTKFKYPTLDIFLESGCDNTFGNNNKRYKIL